MANNLLSYENSTRRLKEILSQVPNVHGAQFVFRNAMRVAPVWFEEQDTDENGDLSIVWHLFHASVLFSDNFTRRGTSTKARLRPSNIFPSPNASDSAALLQEAVRLMDAEVPREPDPYCADLIYSALAVKPDVHAAQEPSEIDPVIQANEYDLTALRESSDWFKAPLWPNESPPPHLEQILERVAARGLYWPTVVQWYRDLAAGTQPDQALVNELREIDNRPNSEDAIREAFIRYWLSKDDSLPMNHTELIAEIRRLRYELAEWRQTSNRSTIPGIGHNNPPEQGTNHEDPSIDTIDERLRQAEIALQGGEAQPAKMNEIGQDLIFAVESARRFLQNPYKVFGGIVVIKAAEQIGIRAADDTYDALLSGVVKVGQMLIKLSFGT